ncbi:MAG TPA: hypothetical protein VF447_02945 [Terriglobales bacterium]
MNAAGPSPAGWKQLYQYALLETNPSQIAGRVADAHAAICNRIRDLDSRPPCDEQQALKAALRFLRILQDETAREWRVA